MNEFLESILKNEVQDFIWAYEQADVQQLLLKHKTIHDVPTALIARQILGRRKAKFKLPTWYATKGIVYPPSINLEQCSSEATAKFKSTLLPALGNGADLTGGFGVDTYFLGLKNTMDYVEPDHDLLQIVEYNHRVLGANNLTYHQATGETFVHSLRESIGFLFLDPSRRKESLKVFKFEDCQPNILKLQSELFHRSSTILLKTSPLYDITRGCLELKDVARVIVVAVENECKELLFLLEKDFQGEPEINAVDIYPKQDLVNSVSFSLKAEEVAMPSFSSPLEFVYEPNAALLKSGAFKWISSQYKIHKLAPSTHLYTSGTKVDFPGRVFRIVEYVSLDKRLKSRFVDGYVNILTRNYPLSVEEIKKKTGLKEGGVEYLICTQSKMEKFTLVAERIR